MVDIESGILPKCSWCFLPVEQGEVIRFIHPFRPEDSHVKITEIVEATCIRLEVFVDVV